MAMELLPAHVTRQLKPKTDLRKLRTRLTDLRQDRSSWLQTARLLGEVFLPRAGQYLVGGKDTQRGRRKDGKILNNTTLRAARTLGQGMHAGMTNPGHPWFKNAPPAGTEDSYAVKVFCDELDNIQRRILRAGNVYRTMPMMYREMAVFGTSAVFVRKNIRPNDVYSPDLSNILHLTLLTFGSYMLAVNQYGQVDTMYRELSMTVDRCVREFGLDNVSEPIRRLWDRQESLDHLVDIVHVIEPRASREVDSPWASEMPFRSTFFEAAGREDKFLTEEGFRRFPVLTPRWDVYGEQDAYGTGPGWEALGDGRGLQHKELRQDQALDYQSNPPLQLPTYLKNGGADLYPGGLSYFDATGPQSGIRNAFEVPLKLNEIMAVIEKNEMRVHEAFYVDLFRAILNDPRSDRTAREVAEIHNEKLLLLGPVVERTENEALKPLVDMAFEAMLEADELRASLKLEPLTPEIPEELQPGDELPLEFDSMLSQALRAARAASVDRFTGTISALGDRMPEILDNLDPDEIAGEYASMLGVPPSITRDPKVRNRLRQARARAEQAAQEAQLAETASKAESNMAQAQATRAAAAPGAAGTDIAPALATSNAIAP